MAHYQAAVIIPSRGGAGVLHYPLDALSAQTERDFQVIVVLDGDIDQSEKVVDDYIARRTLNLTKIVFPENLGRVAALNAGHNAADADIFDSLRRRPGTRSRLCGEPSSLTPRL